MFCNEPNIHNSLITHKKSENVAFILRRDFGPFTTLFKIIAL